MTLTLPKTLLGSTWVPMPSLVLIGPAVRSAIGNKQTNKQTDKHIGFYYVDFYSEFWGLKLHQISNFPLRAPLGELTALLRPPSSSTPPLSALRGSQASSPSLWAKNFAPRKNGLIWRHCRTNKSFLKNSDTLCYTKLLHKLLTSYCLLLLFTLISVHLLQICKISGRTYVSFFCF